MAFCGNSESACVKLSVITNQQLNLLLSQDNTVAKKKGTVAENRAGGCS